MSHGWECPRCHQIWGPSVVRCDCPKPWSVDLLRLNVPCAHEYSNGTHAGCVKCGALPPQPPVNICETKGERA